MLWPSKQGVFCKSRAAYIFFFFLIGMLIFLLRSPPTPLHLSEPYLALVEGVVTGSLFPEAGRCKKPGCSGRDLYDPILRLSGQDWPPIGYTMVGNIRIRNVRTVLEHVVKHDIKGDFVELGVWRGGVCMYARALLNVMNQVHRTVYAFDAWAEMEGYGEDASYLQVSEQEVRSAFARLGLTQGTQFVKGLFKDTIPGFKRNPVAVLRIDGNFYDSYQDALYYLYDLVPLGGVVIFDDYRSHDVVQQAWTDFTRDHGFTEALQFMEDPDPHGVWFIKTVAVTPDFSKRRIT